MNRLSQSHLPERLGRTQVKMLIRIKSRLCRRGIVFFQSAEPTAKIKVIPMDTMCGEGQSRDRPRPTGFVLFKPFCNTVLIVCTPCPRSDAVQMIHNLMSLTSTQIS